MPQAKKGDNVRVHYTGKLTDGTIFDSSLQRDPLEFVVGGGMVIAGFDDGVTGLEVGQSNTVTIPPERGYGARRDDMIIVIPREQFPSHLSANLGDKYQVPDPSGRLSVLTVSDLTDENITLDANHELAGKDLIFEIELIEII
jgi:peptidylprolyl isomerase